MSEEKRFLAAVMFTDIVGYTALMQENESRAKELRDKHRNVLFKYIDEYGGRIVQYYGDGTLSTFPSAVESVRCAVMIQKELMAEPNIPLRVGIHLGDIVLEEGGAYGDGVNIASRIQNLGISGSVLVSGTIYDQCKNQSDIELTSLGKYELKNVKQEISIYAVSSKGLIIPRYEDILVKSGKVQKSIAVLPFVNMSPDPENEYFSDGITEEILNALTKVDGLRVTARTSSFVFKDHHLDIREIGVKLNVKTVLEGSVRKFGNKVRITAQLINVKDGFHIWSEVYDRELKDIFEIQDEISTKIANTLREKLGLNKVESSLVERRTKSMEAYNYYLKGLHYFRKWSVSDMRMGIESFKKAVELDSEYAEAYAWLANCSVLYSMKGQIRDPKKQEQIKSWAMKALELNDNIADPYVALALIKLYFEWEIEESGRLFAIAKRINPNMLDINYGYSQYYIVTGRTNKAIELMEEAAILDPMSMMILNGLGEAYLFAGRYADAEDCYLKTLELDDNFTTAALNLMSLYILRKELEKAEKFLEHLKRKLNPEIQFIILGLNAWIAAQKGDREKMKEYIEKYQAVIGPNVSTDMDKALAYSFLGDMDKTYEYLHKAEQSRQNLLLYLAVHPVRDILSQDQRYFTMLDRLKLRQYYNNSQSNKYAR
jgi:adenylate cyclase